MPVNKQYFKSQCPLIEEFHIKGVLGCMERKQWIFGGRASIAMGSYTTNVTLSSLSNGVVTKLNNYQVLAQKLNAAVANKTFVTSKTTSGFTLTGDQGSTFSLIVFGSDAKPASFTGRWAKDYCPYCKAMNIHGLVSGAIKDELLFSFNWTLASDPQTISFASATNTTGSGKERGQKLSSLVTQMEDESYQIVITDTGASTKPPYPSSLTKVGFALNGDANDVYDIFILGRIKF